jgi:hypothetical protein
MSLSIEPEAKGSKTYFKIRITYSEEETDVRHK